MISQLSGKLIFTDQTSALITVNDIGYEIEMPINCQAKFDLNQPKNTIFTHFVVREDAQLLFGFSSKNIRNAFRALIKASGVGPKAALATLSHFEINDLIQCIETQSIDRLVAIKGVGTKLAKKMAVELKGNLIHFATQTSQSTKTATSNNHITEITAALEALGYKPTQAEQAARQVSQQNENQGLSRENLIKQALQAISA